MDRRTFIRITGGGIALAAGATLPGCSADYPAAAVEAWRGPRDEADPRRWALGFAILAPNPHNRQPWLVDLGQPDQIRLFIDRERLLPETDPFARQIVIGHGTFLELLALALAERGYAADVHLFPEGEPGAAVDARPVAHVRLVSHGGTARDPLFSRILERRSNKQAYDPTRPLTPEVQRVLLASVAGRSVTAAATTEPARMAELRRIARAAWVAEMTTARTYLESARLFRVGPGEIARHRDGISMNSPMLRALNLAGLFDRTEVPVPGSTLYGRVMERWADAETAAGYVWITTDGKSRAAQIEAGRAFARMQLTATSLGLGMHPLSQALQEFEEVRPHYEAMHLALGVEPARQTLQMFARTGYGAPAPPTPRRGVDAIVRA